MKLITDLDNLRNKFKNPVLTIGIFDGVHLAHQRIIREVRRQAQIIKGTSMVLTFNPHPLKVVKTDTPGYLITSLKHRIDLIRQLNADVCLLLDFDKGFSRMSGQEFVKHILVDTLGVSYLIVGTGFRFGRKRSGSFTLLKKLSKTYGFKIRQIKTIRINGQTISSTAIRALIQNGKIRQANKLLGRNFSIYGRVEKGRARGRILGYPTANIRPEQELTPGSGVYAVLVKLDKKVFNGISNVGTRPTFGSEEKLFPAVEVHIFNFHNKIYGRQLEVFFLQRIRPEKKFASQQALLEQIKKDELKAREILGVSLRFPSHYS